MRSQTRHRQPYVIPRHCCSESEIQQLKVCMREHSASPATVLCKSARFPRHYSTSVGRIENTKMLSPHSQNSYYDFLCGGGREPEIVSEPKEVAGPPSGETGVPRTLHNLMLCPFSLVQFRLSPLPQIQYVMHASCLQNSRAQSPLVPPARHSLAHNSVLIPIQCRRMLPSMTFSMDFFISTFFRK